MTTEKKNNHTPEPGEQRFAALVRMIDVDAPAPDDAMLESLRRRAAAVFDESPVAVQSVNEQTTRPVVTQNSRRSGTDNRRNPMIMLLASRGLAGLVAVVSAVALC